MRECRVLKTNELWRLYWQPWRTLLIVSARNAKWPIKNMSKFYKHSFKDFFINRCSKPFTLCPAFVQFQYKTPLPSLSQPCLCNNCSGGGRTTLLKAGPSCDYMHNHGRSLPRFIVCNCDVCAVFGTIASGEQCHIITQLYCLGSKL